MYRFEHVSYLWLLLLIFIIVLVYLVFIQWQKRKIKQIGDIDLAQKLFKGRISGRSFTKFLLLSLALFFAVISLANLQAGGQTETAERKGVDIMFALDVSNSMLARDISPNRLNRSKDLIHGMMDKMKNDRVGLVIFAGKSYLQVPLTIDYGAMKMLLSSVDPRMVPTQGTVLADAINMSSESFSEKERKHKVIVLISDGEDHDTEAIAAAKKAAENGAIIYTVGVGSPNGSTIFDPNTGQDKLDQQGNPVITKLNEESLRNLAMATGGQYLLLANTEKGANFLIDEINKMEVKSFGEVSFKSYKSYYQYFLLGTLIFLILDFILPSAKSLNVNHKVSTNNKA